MILPGGGGLKKLNLVLEAEDSGLELLLQLIINVYIN